MHLVVKTAVTGRFNGLRSCIRSATPVLITSIFPVSVGRGPARTRGPVVSLIGVLLKLPRFA